MQNLNVCFRFFSISNRFRNKLALLLAAPVLLSLSFASLNSVMGAEKSSGPNIVWIMADDLGYSDLGCFGSTYYETPNIDRLAKQGMRLTNHHQCQNCAPTRAALMSGQYGARTGVYTVGGVGRFDWQSRPLRPVENKTNLSLGLTVFAEQLKLAGYTTGMFGKWHVGETGPHHPSKRGFDEAIASMGKHFNFNTSPKTDYPKGQYLADFLTDQAVDFIKRHKAEPFFLYLPHFGVHSPFDAKENWIKHFKPKEPVGGHRNPVYAAMIASVDESVGRVLQTLEELGLEEDTIVVFTSDNGGLGGYKKEGIVSGFGDITDNAPLRCGKGSLYEGGLRVPFIIRWPGVTKPESVCNEPTIHVDLYPTWLGLTNSPLPKQVLDGESLVPLFKDADAKLKREAIFHHFPGYLGSRENTWRTTPVSVIQAGDWKLMEFLEDGHLELYNLKEDLSETKNLATEMPEKAKALHDQLLAWRAEIKAPMPTKNNDIRKPSPLKGKKGGEGKSTKRKKPKGA